MVGTQIGVYKITHLLGEGGMGTVYEAVHEQLGKRVAIKILNSEIARNTEGLTRFFNEARAVNLIEHPGLVQIFEFGELPSGSAYLVMERLHGETLTERLKKTPQLPEPEALYLCYQLAAILAAAHERGIVHRDLKPSNIMLIADSAMPSGERVKLLDFGVAKLASTLHASSSQVRTHSGQTLGTPQYMSPEQYRDVSQVDGMTDVYALGIILYQMIAGRTPFMSSGELAVAAMHMYEDPPLLSVHAPQVTERTHELVHRMLRKAKEERPTMAQVVTVLQTMGISITATPQKNSAISLGSSGSISLAEIQAAERAGLLPDISSPGLRAMPLPRASVPTPSGPVSVTPPSTLGSSAGQLTAKSNRLFWWIAAASGAGVAAILLLTSGVFSDHKPSVVPHVRWCVKTTPTGASVIRTDSGTPLGQTPWTYEHPPGSGKLQLSIQYAGYQPNTLTLDNGRDETLELTLVPLPAPKVEPPPPPPPPPRHHRSHRPKTEEGAEAKEETP